MVASELGIDAEKNCTTNPMVTQQQIRAIFNSIDENEDGVIDLDEIKFVMKNLGYVMPGMWEHNTDLAFSRISAGKLVITQLGNIYTYIYIYIQFLLPFN